MSLPINKINTLITLIMSSCIFLSGCQEVNSDTTQKDLEVTGSSEETELEQLKWLAEKGDVESQYALGKAYDDGEGIVQDDSKAVYWYVKAAKQGHVKSQNLLGDMYYLGEEVEQDVEKAVEFYTKAANQGDADSQAILGGLYFLGNQVPEDINKSIHYLTQAANQGDADSQHILGFIYEKGDKVAQDYKESFKWHLKAAEQGNADSQNSVANMYYEGLGVPMDYDKAVEWYIKAANQNNATARYVKERMYEKNEEGERRKFNEKVRKAEQGDAEAQFGLGLNYFFGLDYGYILAPQDYSKAAGWYLKAANQNHERAQNMLGIMYRDGAGVRQNYGVAKEWFGKACDNGLQTGCDNYKLLHQQGY